MTVERLDWQTAARDGVTVVYGVLIAGLPYLLVGDRVTVSSVAWTDTADPAWHVGTSPTTKPWLATEDLVWALHGAGVETGVDLEALVAQQEAQIQYETDLAGQGYVAFREQYAALDDTDLAILKADVTKKGLYPALLRANNGDPRAAYQAALETAMATNPSYKGHLISGAQPTAQQAAPPTPEEETRATLASAVSGSTSSPLSKIEQPAPPKDDAEMKQQIKAELDRVVNANT